MHFSPTEHANSLLICPRSIVALAAHDQLDTTLDARRIGTSGMQQADNHPRRLHNLRRVGLDVFALNEGLLRRMA